MTGSNRIYGLDILRATAILLVIYLHCNKFLYTHLGSTMFAAAPDGVSIFFVLSGFLIGQILLNLVSGSDFTFSRLKNFWSRRWLRTLPAYFTILIVLIVHRVFTNSSAEFSYYLDFFLFIQNVSYGEPSFFTESWSLSIEEWFYLLMPVCLYASCRFNSKSNLRIALGWIIFTILLFTIIRIVRVQLLDIDNWNEWNIYIRKPLITRLDSIMFGFLGAYLSFTGHAIWNFKKPLFITGIILLLLPSLDLIFFGHTWFTNYVRLSAEGAGTLCLLPLLSSIRSGRGLAFKFFSFVSMISYSMYLVNYTPFRELILPRLTTYTGLTPEPVLAADLIRTACFLAWTFGAGYLLYRFIEKPFMSLRRDAEIAE